jgi:hypothetical protein
LIEVQVQFGLRADVDAYVQRKEADHVNDFVQGADRIRQAGWAAELSMAGSMFSSKSECESTAVGVVGTAIRAVRDQITEESRQRWDASHLHDIPWIYRHLH